MTLLYCLASFLAGAGIGGWAMYGLVQRRVQAQLEYGRRYSFTLGYRAASPRHPLGEPTITVGADSFSEAVEWLVGRALIGEGEEQ
jgi:hypothetical protein